jgi:hypothetical protein
VDGLGKFSLTATQATLPQSKYRMLPQIQKHISMPKQGPTLPVTFSVDDVAPATSPLWTEPLKDQLHRRFQRKILVLPDAGRPVTNVAASQLPDAMRANLDRYVPARQCHPLIDAIHTAFSQHRPLVLSPDAIWLVIAQGFGHHITANAEVLRSRLVRHQGKQELIGKVYVWSVDRFQEAIQSFSSQIREATDPVLHETLICDFPRLRRPLGRLVRSF